MANSSKKSTDKKVFDVAKPGKTTANPTGRPVIVGHGTTIQDPMVQDNSPKKAEDNEPLPPPSLSPKAKVITPPSEEEPKYEKPNEPETEEPKVDTRPETEAVKESDGEEKPAEAVEEKPTEETVEKPAGENEDSEMPQTEKKPEITEEEKKRQAEIEKAIADKKYFLSIKEQKQSHGRSLVMIVILVIILGLVAVDLLMDAGIIKTSFSAPTNFIKN